MFALAITTTRDDTMPDTVYDFTEVLAELDAGQLAAKLSRIVCLVALGVIEHGKKGKVSLVLDMERLGESSQINLGHQISYSKPTLRGKAGEDDATSAIMHVGRAGAVTIMPESQGALDFGQTSRRED